MVDRELKMIDLKKENLQQKEHIQTLEDAAMPSDTDIKA